MRLELEKILLNPDNPRVKKDANFKRLKTSLAQFPQMLQVRGLGVVDNGNGTWTVIGGNQRTSALKELARAFGTPDFDKYGADAVARNTLEDYLNNGFPCVDCTFFTEEQRRRFIVADNLSYGEWDADALKSGWGAEEIATWGTDDVLSSWDVKEEPQALEDDYEMPEEIKTDIQPGDLFEIGPHRLLCGDSTDKAAVEKLMNGQKADMVFTDPPYSSGGYQESGKTAGSIGARGQKKIANDNLSTRGYISLMDKVLANFSEAHTAFIFCDWKMWVYNVDIAEAKGFRVRNMIVWDKMQMGMGMPFRNQHELCLFGSKISGKIGDGKTPNIIQCQRDRSAEHATPKPTALICKMIANIEGENVVDPFNGGGSTMAASHQLGRTCYAMEIDPKYCQVTIDRMLKLDPSLEVKKNGVVYQN